MAATISDLRGWVNEYKRAVARKLGIPISDIPDITIQWGDATGGWASTDGQVITVSKSRAGEPQLEGSIVHELAHAMATIANPSDDPQTNNAIEKIADAVRFHIMQGDDGGWQPDDETQRWARLAPWQLKAVQTSLMNGTYRPAYLKALEDGNITRAEVEGVNSPTSDVPSYYSAIHPPGGSDTGPAGEWVAGEPIPGMPGYIYGPTGEPVKDNSSGNGEKRGEIKDRREDKAYWREYLMGLGIAIDDEMNGLINQAHQKDWDESSFLQKLRETAAYRQRFTGIMDKDGTLKMTEAEYITAEKAYQSYASQYNINMNDKRMGWLFRNDVTPDEFADRATAVSRLRQNKDMYGAFKRELVQAGIAKPSEVNTNKEMFKFIMGQGNQKWADLWQDTVTRNAANQAGIVIARNKDRYTAIGQKALEHISSLGLSEEEMGQRFADLSKVLSEVLPLQEADLYGVKKKTAITAAFGGKNAARARQKIDRAINTDEAFYQDRAASAVYSDESGGLITQGVTDRSRQQQSEY